MAKRRSATVEKEFRTVHVLSDSTGNLPRHMVTAFATQFPAGALTVHEWNFIRTPSELQRRLERIQADPGMVLHAFIGSELKQATEGFCEKVRLPSLDLTGPFVDFLKKHSGLKTVAGRGRLHEMDETYHSRVRAIEFALQHDDGLGLETLAEADIVLTGVSRTGKTPTSVYLAQQGYRAANVSLAYGSIRN
jgi:[pyruvate, water dikinase]-phosphate phosphotransferase / [pyruvate, water dikinase] kinase